MAITPFNKTDLESAMKTRSELEDSLASSPTSYGSSVPSSSDVNTDVQLSKIKERIRSLEGQKLKEDWYGKESALGLESPETGKKENQGPINRILTALSRPLYGIVGATESLVGAGAKDGVLENIKENTQVGHRTFGDLMKKAGTPGFISAPLGFMLDVALDPVNWVTAGTTAVVPKTLRGLTKGGVKGALHGFTSAAGEGFVDAASLIPGVKKTSTFQKAAKKIWNEAERYNALTGYDELAGLNRGGMEGLASFGKFNSADGVTLGNYVEDRIRSFPGGEEFIEKFKYDPHEYMRLVKIKDKITKITNKGDDLSTVDADVSKIIDNSIGSPMKPGSSVELSKLENVIKEGIDDAEFIAKEGVPGSYIHADNVADFEARMLAEAEAEGITKNAVQKYLRMNKDKTGIKFYDDLSDAWGKKIKDFKVGDIKAGEKFLNTLNFATKFFKMAKVPLNPASHTNAVVGNIVMDKMAGWDVTETVPEVIQAYKFLSGKQGPKFIIDNFMKEASDYAKFVATNPNAFKGTYGFDPSLVGGKYFIDHLSKDLRATGLLTAKNEQEFLEQLAKMPEELRAALDNAAEAAGAAKGSAVRELQDFVKSNKSMKIETPTEMIERYSKAGKPELAGDPSSVIQDLGITGGPGMDFIKRKAAEGNIVYKGLQNIMEKGMNTFEMHDQASKLGKAIHATKTGLTAESLAKLSRLVPGGISRADIVGEAVVNGRKRYRLTWDKATDLVNETNMNYSAMPAFVRMMRSMPILGAPFLSFSYAMVPKTAKTLLHNPASFNQINFMIHELSGAKTPIEKKNLESKYAQWFNSPAMLRVPFMDSHPAYVNLANFLPYYSMSLWSQSNRSYKDMLPDTLVKTVDKSQLFKDPAGQVLFDYFIMPLLLDGERPLNQFGQPLYPESATGINKLGYAARTLFEAYTPGFLGAAGLPVGGVMENVAPGSSKYIPSYTFRKLANATQQKSSLGIPKKESSVELVTKALSGLAGLPVDTMDITYLQDNPKK